MRKSIILSGLLATLFFTGCGASNGLGMGKQEVKHYFQQGEIVKIAKVTVSKSMLATVSGAGAGAVAGGVIGAKNDNTLKGAGLGAIVGAGLGFVTGYALNGNEKEAYEVDVKNISTNKVQKAYLEEPLEVGTKVEYVDREDVITNINVLKNSQALTKK